MYYLYHPVIRSTLDLCAAIVQLYPTYSLHFIVLRVSSNFCVNYLYYFAALKQIICALAAPAQLVPSTASRLPPPLNSQWWISRSGCLPLTVDMPALTCPHWFRLTNQA